MESNNYDYKTVQKTFVSYDVNYNMCKRVYNKYINKYPN